MLYDPPSHEPLTDRPWDEGRVRAAIAAIVAETESAFDDTELWPAHPRDLDDGPLPAVSSLFLGASGVIWALHELERAASPTSAATGRPSPSGWSSTTRPSRTSRISLREPPPRC